MPGGAKTVPRFGEKPRVRARPWLESPCLSLLKSGYFSRLVRRSDPSGVDLDSKLGFDSDGQGKNLSGWPRPPSKRGCK